MKAKYLFFISCLCLLLACKDDNNGSGSVINSDNKELNQWIYQQMDKNYLWYNELPSESSLDFASTPSNFFTRLINSKDRFSYMESNLSKTRSSIASYDLGFNFVGYFINNTSNSPIILFVTYIKEGSSLESVLKRGDLITGYNGVPITNNNVDQLINSTTPFEATINYTSKVKISPIQDFKENPLYLSKVFEQGGKKIGYMVYNFFANGPTEENDDNAYALEVNNILSDFKAQGISELILDFRYNPGGYVSSGTYIASAIAPNRSGKIYTKRNYNDKLERISSYASSKNNYFADYIRQNNVSYEIPQLDLPRIIVITSRATASASEQIINGLRPYLTVEVLGETTYGKNLESFAIEYSKGSVDMILHPITSVSYNSAYNDPTLNDYSRGFQPTIDVYDEDIDEVSRGGKWIVDSNNNLLPPLQAQIELGDPNETLLRIALNFIATGNRSISNRSSFRNSEIQVSQLPLQNQKGGAIIDKVN